MIPNYQITQQSVTPQEILDVVPEQEASDRAIQASEERYLQQLEKNNADSVRNTEKTWSQLADLSSTFGDIIKKKQEKHRSDREAQISLDILTNGVSPELEAHFKGEESALFDDDLATQEFASKYEADTGDSITAQEFRKMAGWEKYMVAKQYALQKAKGYDQYVYDAYETTKIDIVRDGQTVSVGHLDNLSPSEQAALDEKIKFEYARQFAGLNEALVATVVKPEIDKFDEKRRKEQAVRREKAYQIQVAESDSKMIELGFATANPEDGHQLAHDWAARYAARNRVSIQAGRIAFKENLIDLVSENKISYPEAMSIVNHEIEARDGSIKTMGSWKEWDGLTGELADAAKKGVQAREEQKDAQIIADVEAIKSYGDLGNDQKTLLMAHYKSQYDGYVPNEIAGALAGHMDDDMAEQMIQESIRYQGGVYDFDMANVSTKIFNKHKDKIIQSTALTPGTDDEKEGAEWVKSWTNEASEDRFGETDIKSPKWLALRDNLQAVFDKTYKSTYIRNGQVVSTPEQAMAAAKQAVQVAASNPQAVINMSDTDFATEDETYSRMMQVSMTQSAGGKWRTNKITSNAEIEKGLVNWQNSPLKQLKDVPTYYRDLAMRIGVNPINFANAQVRFLVEDEVKDDDKDDKLDDVVKNLIYKFPTRGRITRARYEAQGAGEQNVKTSIYNKKANTIKDE